MTNSRRRLSPATIQFSQAHSLQISTWTRTIKPLQMLDGAFQPWAAKSPEWWPSTFTKIIKPQTADKPSFPNKAKPTEWPSPIPMKAEKPRRNIASFMATSRSMAEIFAVLWQIAPSENIQESLASIQQIFDGKSENDQQNSRQVKNHSLLRKIHRHINRRLNHEIYNHPQRHRHRLLLQRQRYSRTLGKNQHPRLHELACRPLPALNENHCRNKATVSFSH